MFYAIFIFYMEIKTVKDFIDVALSLGVLFEWKGMC